MSNLGPQSSIYASAQKFMIDSVQERYSFNFEYLGRPIIQYPQDIIAMQELIWRVQPDLIIETGIAHGGTLIMSASMLALLDYCDAVKNSQVLDLVNPRRKVLGVDIDIRAHNRAAIQAHPMSSRIEMIQGSSIESEIVAQVHQRAQGNASILICLDSNHTHDHVLAELQAYGSLVTPGSYCVVFDTIIEDLPADMHSDKPWGPGNSPKSAVHEYLKSHPEFEIDRQIDSKLVISVAPDGYLKKIR
jgi:cephalosporin hydroxylase